MRAGRFALITGYVILMMAGVIVGRRSFAIGMVLVALALVSMTIHLLLERSERIAEQDQRHAWEAEIRRIADDVSLEGYGIESISELARYHDAAGRAEVLETLRSLPVGQRNILNAARQVDPNAVWD
jgi:hypothetical protein